MTLTSELGLDIIKTNKPQACQISGQRSCSSNVIVRTYRHWRANRNRDHWSGQ